MMMMMASPSLYLVPGLVCSPPLLPQAVHLVCICGNIDEHVLDYAYVDYGGDVVKERKLDSRNRSMASFSFNLS